MDRRSTLTGAGVLFLSTIGGCLDREPNSSEPADSDDVGDIEGNGTETTTGDAPSTESNKSATDDSDEANDDVEVRRLEIRSMADEVVRATLTLSEYTEDREISTVVYQQTHEFESNDRVTLHEHFECGQDYWFEVVVEEEAIFERHIWSYEALRLEIQSPTVVEIASITEDVCPGDG